LSVNERPKRRRAAALQMNLIYQAIKKIELTGVMVKV
jgi:hypothetical protein